MEYANNVDEAVDMFLKNGECSVDIRELVRAVDRVLEKKGIQNVLYNTYCDWTFKSK